MDESQCDYAQMSCEAKVASDEEQSYFRRASCEENYRFSRHTPYLLRLPETKIREHFGEGEVAKTLES